MHTKFESVELYFRLRQRESTHRRRKELFWLFDVMHDQRKPASMAEKNLLERRRQGRDFANGFHEKEGNLKLTFKENITPNSPSFADFNRYSFPLSPCSPSGKPAKTFNDVINENINSQRQEKRAVSLMPEILLHSAVLDNNIDEIRKLLKVDRVDLNRGAKLGLFSLHQAAFSGFEEITEILVEHGADMTIETPEGLTPLEVAVCAGNFECAEILIKNGASVDSIKNGFVDRSFCNATGENSFPQRGN